MNNKAVSAVIGVIMLIAITVAIAATVWIYINELEDERYEYYLYKDGNFYKCYNFKDDKFKLKIISPENITGEKEVNFKGIVVFPDGDEYKLTNFEEGIHKR